MCGVMALGFGFYFSYNILFPSARTERKQRSSYTAYLISLLQMGRPFPRGKQAKQKMYQAYLEDAKVHSTEPPKFFSSNRDSNRDDSLLRLMLWNVHFWRSGYSSEELALPGSSDSSNLKQVVATVSKVAPDVLLLQEVVNVGINPPLAALEKAGYRLCVIAGSPDVHVLPENQPSFAGQRLQVAVLVKTASQKRIEIVRTEMVPMDGGKNGHAAFALLRVNRHLIAVYCVHSSVRCEGSLRLTEVQSLVRHADSLDEGAVEVFLGGDLNQPYFAEYSNAEWEVMSKDMRGAQLPLTDGVADFLRAHNFRDSFEESSTVAPGISAWNAARVDFLYHRRLKPVADASVFIRDCSFIFSPASDHYPLVCDVHANVKRSNNKI